MKIALTMIVCSLLRTECMHPSTFPNTHDDFYSCMKEGYQLALDKTQEMGRKNINSELIYIKFSCTQVPGSDA